MTKITQEAFKQAEVCSINIRKAWLCIDNNGIVISVKAYRAEATAAFKRSDCAGFYCPRGPVVFEIVSTNKV